MKINEDNLFYGVFILILIEFIWDVYLFLRQHKVLLNSSQIPTEFIGILPQKTFDKARRYAIDKCRYNLITDILTFAISMGILFLNVLPIIWRLAETLLKRSGFEYGEISQSGLFIMLLNIFNSITILPFSLYHTFVLEHKHGFNRQTVEFFLRDKLKMHTLEQVLLIPLVCAVVFIIRIGGDYFFIYAWVFVMLAALFLYTLYPEYIAPFFDKYSPLPEGELKKEIEKLASNLGFPLYGLYIIEGSKRSAHSNAFIFGAFNNKRIVVFDTLIKDYLKAEKAKLKNDEKPEDEKEEGKAKGEKIRKGCDMNEVLAIVGHELGHWKFNHIAKKMAVIQANVLLVFVLFAVLIHQKALYRAFGFYDGAPIVIGLIILIHFILLPYFGILTFVLATMSRYFEFQADRFSKSLGRGHFLKSALIKLHVDNLGFPIFDPWYSAWHNSHPALLERLRALDKDE